MVEMAPSAFSSSIFTVLILWVAITSTNSPLLTGITAGLMTTPLVLGVVIGSIVDRARSKKSVALFATVLKAATPLLFFPSSYMASQASRSH